MSVVRVQCFPTQFLETSMSLFGVSKDFQTAGGEVYRSHHAFSSKRGAASIGLCPSMRFDRRAPIGPCAWFRLGACANAALLGRFATQSPVHSFRPSTVPSGVQSAGALGFTW